MKTRPRRSPAVGRRRLVLGSLGAALALATGCTTGAPGVGVPKTTRPEGEGSASPTTAPDPVLGATFALIAAQREFVTSAQVTYPQLVSRCRWLLKAHDAHLGLLSELLGNNLPPALSPRSVPERRSGAAAAVGRTTLALIVDLSRSAASVEDAALARALASMSAGVAQAASAGGWPVPETGTSALTLDVPLDQAHVAVIQETLSREHANLWWYGVLGGRTSATSTPQLFAHVSHAYGVHLRQRDVLVASLVAAEVVPDAAAPNYRLPGTLATPRQVAGAARTIEQENAAAYAWLVSKSPAEARGWGIAAWRNAAIRELDFQGTPENFPGSDEFADR